MSQQLILALVWAGVTFFVYWSVFRSLEKEIRLRQYFWLAYDATWVVYTTTGFIYYVLNFFKS